MDEKGELSPSVDSRRRSLPPRCARGVGVEDERDAGGEEERSKATVPHPSLASNLARRMGLSVSDLSRRMGYWAVQLCGVQWAGYVDGPP